MIPVDPQLLEVLGQPVPSGDELMFNCPFYHYDARAGGHKPDTKRRLYVNTRKDKFTCYRCKAGGSLRTLYRKLGLSLQHRASVSRYVQIVNAFKYGQPLSGEADTATSVQLPDDWVAPLTPSMEGYRYLVGRGIGPDLIADRRIVLGRESLSGRVVFPSYDREDKLDYWVARLYVDDPKGRRPKYKNPSKKDGAGRASKLYWFDQIASEDIFIAEGVISALAVGRNATCTFGVNVTGAQIDRLARAAFETYYIVFDGEYDARKDALELAATLHMIGCQIRIVDMPDGQDPASIPRSELHRRIAEAWPYSRMNTARYLLRAQNGEYTRNV